VTRGTIPSISRAVHALRNRLPDLPEIVVVLGSGLSDLVDQVERPVTVPFSDVAGFPPTTVAGHPGRYVFGILEGRRVLLQAGRFHFYEGCPSEVVGAPVRVAHALGAETLILTNAAGGIDRRLEPGAIVLVEDHVNMQWRSPLIGPVGDGEGRWPDMSTPYDPDLQAIALAAARTVGVQLTRGTYAAVLGPSYETPAEIRMLRSLGVDAVGMSTVPEVLLARALGLRVAAFSVIANRASGLAAGPLSHDDVTEVVQRASESLARVLRLVVRDAPV